MDNMERMRHGESSDRILLQRPLLQFLFDRYAVEKSDAAVLRHQLLDRADAADDGRPPETAEVRPFFQEGIVQNPSRTGSFLTDKQVSAEQRRQVLLTAPQRAAGRTDADERLIGQLFETELALVEVAFDQREIDFPLLDQTSQRGRIVDDHRQNDVADTAPGSARSAPA